MSDFTVFKIEYDETPFELKVEMSSASLIQFTLNYEDMDYHEVLKDVCGVAIHMIKFDSDLMEMHDDAGRTRPKREDVIAVRDFLRKYEGRVPESLREMFL